MRYKPRSGLVLTSICDEYLLVATKEAREYVPKVLQINDSAAEIWNLLCAQKTNQQIEDYFKENYELPDGVDLQTMIIEFENEMYEKGYLINEKEESE